MPIEIGPVPFLLAHLAFRPLVPCSKLRTVAELPSRSVDVFDLANPSRVGNAPGVAAPPPPRVSVPVIPQFK